MGEIAIIKTDIDWLKIINLALNKQDWGMTYTLYQCEDVTLTCYMESFDFPNSKAKFRLTVNYNYKNKAYGGSDWNNYDHIEYRLNNFTIDDFKTVLNTKVKNLLKRILDEHTKKDAENEFSDLKYYSWNIDLSEEVEDYGFNEDYELIDSLNDKNLKENCLEELMDKICEIKNRVYQSKVDAYIVNNKTIIPGINNILNDLLEDEE